MTEQRLPEYLRRILAGGWEASPGEVVEVVVFHDHDCAHWRGAACDCDPEIRIVSTAEKKA